MSGGDHGPKPCLTHGNGRKADGHGKNSPLEQSTAELLGRFRFPQHNGNDWSLAVSGIEPGLLYSFPELARVAPQLVYQVGRSFENIDSSTTGSDISRCRSAGKKERSSLLTDVIDDDSFACYKSSHYAEGF